MSNNNLKSFYLPGLNGIRAIAAISVIISHTGLNLDNFGLEKLGGYSLANFGVTMFFALSGFLITYLLLLEKEKINTINIKKFYIRRALRIWPLYYFYFFLVMIVTSFYWKENSWLYLVMLPNVPFTYKSIGLATLGSLPHLTHYWSVGVEEQFYAFWPWLIKHSKKILLSLTIFFIAFTALKLSLTVFNAPNFWRVLLLYTRFGCLALGGIVAFLIYHKNPILQTLFNNPISEFAAWGLVILAAINKFHIFTIIDHEIFAIATLAIISNQVSNPKRLISLENKLFDYLGKISYGLYIYNPLIIFLISKPISKLINHTNTWYNYLFIYGITMLLVVLVSHISYFYFEKPILKFKNKFAVVKSRSSKN